MTVPIDARARGDGEEGDKWRPAHLPDVADQRLDGRAWHDLPISGEHVLRPLRLRGEPA